MNYQPRTEAQITSRAMQNEELIPLLVPKRFKKPRTAARKRSEARVTKKSICSACGHEKQHHCNSPQSHIPNEDGTGWHNCILSHCECGIRLDAEGIHLCPCVAFEFNGKITPWKPPIKPETLCNRCQHPRKHHCHKGAKTIEVDGVPHICHHYRDWAEGGMNGEPCCDSTACAETLDPEQRAFCPCSKFMSPYARRGKTERKMTPMSLFPREDLERAHALYEAERQSKRVKTKAEILIEIAREDPTCTVAELADAAERSPSWVRKHLQVAGIVLAKPVRQNGRKP
jgi:hypothetical protein